MADWISELLRGRKLRGIEKQRLTQAADLVPGLERHYDRNAVTQWIRDVDPNTRLAVIDPADFEKVALPLVGSTRRNFNVYKKLGDEKGMLKFQPIRSHGRAIDALQELIGNGGFDEMPYLNFEPVANPSSSPRQQIFEAMEHEGRHRARALSQEGIDRALIGIYGSRQYGFPNSGSLLKPEWVDPKYRPKSLQEDRPLVPGSEFFKAEPFADGGLIPKGPRGLRAIEYLKRVLPSKYASMEMQPLTGGSGRVPVKLGDSMIAKVANMPRGLRENAWSRDYLLQNEGVIPRLEDISEDDDWIITEFLKQNRGDPARAKALASDLSHALATGTGRNIGWEGDAFRRMLEDKKLGILQSYGQGQHIGDFVAPRHWRFRGEQPVMIDSGSLVPGADDPMPFDELRPIFQKYENHGVISPRQTAIARLKSFERKVTPNNPNGDLQGLRSTYKLGFAGGGRISGEGGLPGRPHGSYNHGRRAGGLGCFCDG